MGIKIGVIKEGKTPPDKRVPLSPKQCKEIVDSYSNVEIFIQKSEIRKFKDSEYEAMGLNVVDSIDHCDIIIGVKEVPISMLIPNKTFFFFSHTIKEQPYNRDLLLAIMEKNIKLIDWETLTAASGKRLIGFGRYAGIVGCYNSFLAYGEKTGAYSLKPANLCEDRVEMESELAKVKLPSNYKIVLTGFGRVGKGAIEIIEKLGLKEVSPEDFKSKTFDQPVWTSLKVDHYNARIDGADFSRKDFYNDPEGFKSTFSDYSSVANMYIACHYWDARSPFIYTREDMKSDSWNIEVVGDISCDIDGPVASTIRPSKISDPIYGYDPISEKEANHTDKGIITVMAVDNLPCELPKDASEDFGSEFLKYILPNIAGEDADTILERATMTENKELTKYYAYLQDYVDGKLVEA